MVTPVGATVGGVEVVGRKGSAGTPAGVDTCDAPARELLVVACAMLPLVADDLLELATEALRVDGALADVADVVADVGAGLDDRVAALDRRALRSA